MIELLFGYLILGVIVTAYFGLVVEDYVQAIKFAGMKGKEVTQYVALRVARDLIVIGSILLVFYAASSGILDAVL